MQYYNARYYDPVLSRFISPDSVNHQQNRYAYVGGNPISNSDPSGNKFLSETEGSIYYRTPITNYGSSKSEDEPDMHTMQIVEKYYSKKPYQGLSYKSPYYSGVVIRPDDPRYIQQYTQYVKELKLVQQTSTTYEDMLRRLVSYIYFRNPYNPTLTAEWSKQDRLYQRINQLEENINNFADPSGNNYVLEKKGLKAKMLLSITKRNIYLSETEYEPLIWSKFLNTTETIDQIESNQAICGTFAFIARYSFKELGIKTYMQTVEFNNYNFYHANLYGYFGGEKWVIDPTWNLVMPFKKYKNFLSSISDYYGGIVAQPEKIHFKTVTSNLEN